MSKKFQKAYPKPNYQDPRWQKKRLEILSRDDWRCQMCGDPVTTLHVHHTYYKKGLELWGYPNESLITLCADCHKREHDYENGAMAEIMESIKMAKAYGFLLVDVRDVINKVLLGFNDRDDFVYRLCIFQAQPRPSKLLSIPKKGIKEAGK